jgi:glycerophosphoryl diester phosphodiesterase
MIIAHRGSAVRGAAENTIRAFREAIKDGADGVEMDVRGTKDGRLIVMHDDVVDLPGGGRAAVRDTKLEDLRDRTTPAEDRTPGLEEALRSLLARTGVIIEIKEPGLEKKVASVITSMKAATRLKWLLVASFHPSVVSGLARYAPDVRRALIVSPGGPGLAGMMRGRMAAGAFNRSGADDLMPRSDRVDAKLVRHVTKRSGRVIPWSVNDPHEALDLADLGCEGIITDDVAGVRAAFG